MAIVFPLTMPTDVFIKCLFQLTTVTTRTKVRGGSTFGTALTEPSWTVTIATRPLILREQGQWQAFFDSLRGGVKSALLYNPRRRYPVEYRTSLFTGLVIAGGATPFVGLANLQTIISTREIYVNQLPALFQFRAGDLISVEKDGRYSLHRIQQDVAASGGGVATSVLIEPQLPEFFLVGSVVRVLDARGEFTIDPDSIQGDEETASPHPISFTARQRIF